MSNNNICDILEIKYPIIQAAMAWLTDAKQVAAVGEAGGLGVLGPNAGQTTLTASVEETGERMRAEIRKVRELTNKPFAVNLITSPYKDDVFTDALAKVIFEEKVPAVVIAGPVSKELFQEVKRNGVTLLYRPIDPSIAVAKEAEALGVDILIATGFDEGGTLPSQVLSTMNIVPLLADNVSIPVIAAGGIGDVRSVRALKAVGADGFYVGTRFLAAVESRAAESVKQLIVDSNAADLLLFRTTPSYYRSLDGKLARKLVAMDQAGASREEIGKEMGGLGGIKRGMLEGNLDEGYISVGTGISNIHNILSSKEIIEELMQDYIS